MIDFFETLVPNHQLRLALLWAFGIAVVLQLIKIVRQRLRGERITITETARSSGKYVLISVVGVALLLVIGFVLFALTFQF